VAKKLKVTLVKSIIGLSPKQEATVYALGLRRIRQVVEHDDTPTIRGMIRQVPFAVAVEVRGAGVAVGAEAGGEATDQTTSAKRAEPSGSKGKVKS
jgi:large subunit ribosomal protein L30